MEAWLIYDKKAAEYNRRYIQFYIEEGAALDIHIRLILTEELEFGIKNGRWFINCHHQEISCPDFAICRSIYPLLSRQLELMGISVFNNAHVAEICNDKARTYQYLASTGITMVDSSFYKSRQVQELLYHTEHPSVIKAVDGHGGGQVFLIQPEQEKETGLMSEEKHTILDGLGSSDVVMQPLIGSRHQDLRVYVIGQEILAAVLRTAKQGFKSNFSLGGEVRLYELLEEERRIVRTIINQFEFGMVGIDFIIGDEGKLIFNEIEDVVGARMLYQCSDINLVKHYLTFIKKQLY